MNRKTRNIIYLTFGIIILYSLIAIPVGNYLAKSYDTELNEKRIEYRLLPITKNWKLDSIVLQSPSRGFDCFLEHVNDTTYEILENKWYCQYWTNKKIDKSKPYLKSKEIFFYKSFWIWQNRLSFEVNTYINPNTDIADYAQLETTSLLEDETIFYTHLSHHNIKDEYNFFQVDSNFNNSRIEKREQKVDSILKMWKFKIKHYTQQQ